MRGVFSGASVIFFSFIGFDTVATAAEECLCPQRDLPIGIIGSLGICTVLYILMCLVITGMQVGVGVPRWVWMSLGVWMFLPEGVPSSAQGGRGSGPGSQLGRWDHIMCRYAPSLYIHISILSDALPYLPLPIAAP